MTTGDTLCIEYNCEKFYINVLKVVPNGKACIIETDCEVDFATPLDYKEPEKVFPKQKKAAPEVSTLYFHHTPHNTSTGLRKTVVCREWRATYLCACVVEQLTLFPASNPMLCPVVI